LIIHLSFIFTTFFLAALQPLPRDPPPHFATMDHIAGHLFRRGMDAHAIFRAASAGEPSPEKPSYEMPFWGTALLAGTIIFFTLMLSMVS
jgi:hypothetical protein